jgi:hypothetical protein
VERVSIEIAVRETPQPEIHFTSSETVYVEGLVGDEWVGRCWGARGRIVSPYWQQVRPGFELEVKDDPNHEAHVVSRGWRCESATEAPRTDRGARHFVVELTNTVHPLTIKLHTLLDGTPVLTRWLEITNTSSRPVAVTKCSPWAGRLWPEDAPITLGHSLRRDVTWEGWFGWTPLAPGVNDFSNQTHQLWDDPYFILRNESNAEYFFGQLAWPAPYMMEFLKEDGLSFKIGPSAPSVLRVIAPAETVTTPSVHLGFVKRDFDACVQAMHDHTRRSVLPTPSPRRSYLAQYLIPEDQPMTVYRGDDCNETNLRKCIDVAAAAGLEVFILDGPTWCSGYGNWLVPMPSRFPNGLAPLVEHAYSKGMLFGLYAEPEGGRDGSASPGQAMANWSESEVFREHPEWFVGIKLNLAIPKAAAYLESELGAIVEHYRLDLYRHDENSPVCDPPGPGSAVTARDGFAESNYWRHYDALYGAFDRLHAAHPQLILQQASAGGYRLDLATAGRFHEHFTSDRATMPWMYRMSSGMSVHLPPEILVSPNGMAWPRDLPDLDTTLRGAFALGNTPMIFNSVLPRSLEEFEPGAREKFLHYAHLYKTFMRPLLPTIKVYHHAPVNATGGVESGDWFAMEFTSPDRRKGWATIIRLSGAGTDTYVFTPKGFDPNQSYAVTFDNTGRTETLGGSDLAGRGLSISPGPERSSELLLFEAN